MKKNDVPLSVNDREALVRDVFDANRAVAWASDWREKRNDPVFARQPPDQLREAYFRHLEKLWPEWETEAKAYSNSKLTDMLQDAIELGNALGMPDYREHNMQTPNSAQQTLRQASDSKGEAFRKILRDDPAARQEVTVVDMDRGRDR